MRFPEMEVVANAKVELYYSSTKQLHQATFKSLKTKPSYHSPCYGLQLTIEKLVKYLSGSRQRRHVL